MPAPDTASAPPLSGKKTSMPKKGNKLFARMKNVLTGKSNMFGKIAGVLLISTIIFNMSWLLPHFIPSLDPTVLQPYWLWLSALLLFYLLLPCSRK